MKIYHWSDNHGKFDRLFRFVEEHGLPDVFVCTGDILPNSWTVFRKTKEQEADWQRDWVKKNGQSLKDVVQDRPLLYVLGNHDFVEMEPLFLDLNINAIRVSSWGIEYQGFKWAGYPEIPWIGGFWNKECDNTALSRITEEVILANPDILVTHSPPANILDECHDGEHPGNLPLANALACGRLTPKVHLFGHIHEQGGRQEQIEDTLFVNSAMTIQRIEV